MALCPVEICRDLQKKKKEKKKKFEVKYDVEQGLTAYIVRGNEEFINVGWLVGYVHT